MNNLDAMIYASWALRAQYRDLFRTAAEYSASHEWLSGEVLDNWCLMIEQACDIRDAYEAMRYMVRERKAVQY